MKELKELRNKTKAWLFIEVDEHKTNYQSAREYLEEQSRIDEELKEDIWGEIYNEMIKRDSIVNIKAYINTPVWFKEVWHYDLIEAIKDINND